MQGRTRRREKPVIRTMLQTAVEMFRSARYALIKELNKVAVILQILIPVVIAGSDYGITGKVVLSACLVCLSRYIIRIWETLNSTVDGIPIPEKRFTVVDNRGFISLENQDDYPELIQYVNELENYLQSKGKLT